MENQITTSDIESFIQDFSMVISLEVNHEQIFNILKILYQYGTISLGNLAKKTNINIDLMIKILNHYGYYKLWTHKQSGKCHICQITYIGERIYEYHINERRNLLMKTARETIDMVLSEELDFLNKEKKEQVVQRLISELAMEKTMIQDKECTKEEIYRQYEADIDMLTNLFRCASRYLGHVQREVGTDEQELKDVQLIHEMQAFLHKQKEQIRAMCFAETGMSLEA